MRRNDLAHPHVSGFFHKFELKRSTLLRNCSFFFKLFYFLKFPIIILFFPFFLPSWNPQYEPNYANPHATPNSEKIINRSKKQSKTKKNSNDSKERTRRREEEDEEGGGGKDDTRADQNLYSLISS